MRYQFVTPLDSLERPDEALLLYPSQLIRLGPLGIALARSATAEPLSTAQLAIAVIGQFGPPATGDPEQLIAGQIGELIANGVLREVQDDVDDF